MEALTGIRAFAACAVVFQHYQITLLPPQYHIRGYLGVDMFFILSGFVISHAHASDFINFKSWRKLFYFYGLRLARIYPMHVVTLLFMVAAFAAATMFHIYDGAIFISQKKSFVVNVLLMQGWWRQPVSWNYPAWSVSSEWFIYLLFPFLALGLVRLTPLRAVVLIALDLIFYSYVYFVWFGHDVSLWTSGIGLLRIVCEFSLGSLLWSVTSHRQSPWYFKSAVALSIVAAVAWYWASPFADLVAVFSFAAIVVTCAHDDNPLSRLLTLPLFVYLGEISYSIYMVHAPVALVTIGHSHSVARAIVSMGLTIATAALCYRFIETPARRWYRNVTALPAKRPIVA